MAHRSDSIATRFAAASLGVAATMQKDAWRRTHRGDRVRPDWTLSRQRQWGVPMAFFVHKETGELHPRRPS